jgi:hypothetical protein
MAAVSAAVASPQAREQILRSARMVRAAAAETSAHTASTRPTLVFGRHRNLRARQRCADTYEHTLELKIRLGLAPSPDLEWIGPGSADFGDVVVLELLPGGASDS